MELVVRCSGLAGLLRQPLEGPEELVGAPVGRSDLAALRLQLAEGPEELVALAAVVDLVELRWQLLVHEGDALVRRLESLTSLWFVTFRRTIDDQSHWPCVDKIN